MPFVVQRKKHEDAQKVYGEILESIKKGNQTFIEITCEKMEEKKITVLTSEIIAIQMYAKTSSSGTSKRPGFSVQN